MVPDRIFVFFLFPLTPPRGTRRTLPTQRPIGPRPIFPFSLYATSWHRAEVPGILPNRSPTDFFFLTCTTSWYILFLFFLFLHYLVTQSRTPRHTAQTVPDRPFFSFSFLFLHHLVAHHLVEQSRSFRRIAKTVHNNYEAT